jgi:hypothetical protein
MSSQSNFILKLALPTIPVYQYMRIILFNIANTERSIKIRESLNTFVRNILWIAVIACQIVTIDSNILTSSNINEKFKEIFNLQQHSRVRNGTVNE